MWGVLKNTVPRMQNNATPSKEAHVLNAQNICSHHGILHWGFAAVGKVMDLKWEMILDDSSP